MPRKPRSETVQCRHFRWHLRRRGAVYMADGRASQRDVGRHSLATKDRQVALQRLHELDQVKAVELGLADRVDSEASRPAALALETGSDAYLAHLARPAIAGGATAKSRQRYRAVFDKFIIFAQRRAITSWNQVDKAVLTAYLTELERRLYAARTVYLEAVLIMQFLRWAISEKHLPPECGISLRLRKPSGTTTYCWKPLEVDALLDFCRSTPQLAWLAVVILVLSRTGLRIGEAAALRWADIDFDRNIIHIANDTGAAEGGVRQQRRTKNREDRWCPMPADLRAVLYGLDRGQDGRVLRGPRGGELKADTVRTILIRDAIKPLADRFPASPGERGFQNGRLHSFRHFFCSCCANQGVPERMVSQWLGHKDSAMIRVYYHMHDDDAQRQIKNVDFAGAGGRNGAAASA